MPDVPDIFVHTNVVCVEIKSFQKIWTRIFLNTKVFPALENCLSTPFSPFLGGTVEVSSSLCLFAYCRLVMAALCFIPSFTSRTRGFGFALGENDGLWEPRTLALLLFVCVVDAAYMLSMYQVPLAFRRFSNKSMP